MQDSLIKYYHKHDHQQCFVGHSHKTPQRDDIISACEETLPKFGLHPWYADDQFEPTKSLRDKVVEMVANARYGIYDLSWWRPDEQSAWKMPQNVLIELGMAIALNRPALLLRHAENRASGLPLPTCLDSISQRIVEFSGGPTLKHALEERLPQWLDVPPERAWWMRYCLFGERTCTYRESYPQIIQCGQKTIGCHIADGKDIDRPDFRSLIEDELGRYSDISFDYLDALLPTTGYDFRLCTYCQIVRSTPFAIYRITPETTAETFIAIGMSIALEKQFKCEIPKFIFTTDARSVPSLLAGYEVVEAKTAKERQKRLRKFIPVVMRKVRESLWKPEPLPFVEFLPPTSETSLFEQEQALFSETDEKHSASNSEEDTKDAEVDDANEVALKQLEEDIRLHPNNAHIYNDKGEATAALRRYEEALNAYNKAIELEPNNPTFYYNRGRVYQAQKEFKEALEDFEMTIVLNPEYSDARRQRDILWNILSKDTTYSRRLRQARVERRWTQQEVADLINVPDSHTIGRWERGINFPSAHYCRELCRIFGKTLEELGLNHSDQSQENVKFPENNEDIQKYSRSQQLRQTRLEREWTQEELAEKIGTTGVTISRWENGVTFPNRYFRQKLCQLFDKTEEELGFRLVSNKEIAPLNVLKENNGGTQKHLRGNQQLRKAREDLGWSRTEVAMKIGTDERSIRRWENGDVFPGSHFRQKLCQLFNKTEEELGLEHTLGIIYNLKNEDAPSNILEDHNEEEERRRRENVIEQLSSRQLEVLQAFANGLHPSEVVEQLSISASTVITHTTVLLSLCRTAWSIEAKERLDYRFLQSKFEKYFDELDQPEDE